MKQKVMFFIIKKLNRLFDKLGYDCCTYVQDRQDGYFYVSRNAVNTYTTKMFDAMETVERSPDFVEKEFRGFIGDYTNI